MKSRLVIIECVGYIFWQLFLQATIVVREIWGSCYASSVAGIIDVIKNRIQVRNEDLSVRVEITCIGSLSLRFM